jgi:hypothetical protein
MSAWPEHERAEAPRTPADERTSPERNRIDGVTGD